MTGVALKEAIMAPPAELDFGEGDFLESGPIERIGERLIHDRFPDLSQFKIAFLWKKRGGARRGQARFGSTQMPTGLLAFYCEYTFVIWLAADTFREAHWGSAEIEAALFHELCECGTDDDGNPRLQWYDFTGFTKEFREYGAWNAELKDMTDVVQLTLFDKRDGH